MPSPIVTQESAGGVVMQRGRVLLIRIRTRSGRTVWTFPKGRIEEGEQPVETAVREVREETGYQCQVTTGLGPPHQYQFVVQGRRIRKRVTWFLMRSARKVGRHDPEEVEEARWVPLREAYTKLFYRSDRNLLRTAEEENA